MERFSRRECARLGYSPQRSFPTSDHTKSDVNFSDVFGGPPRRSSMYEVRRRYSSSRTADSDALRGGAGVDDDEDDDDETSLPYRGSWTGVREKPVFGEDSANRRRNKGSDFFHDIFGGHESSNPTPRKQHHDLSGISDPYSQISLPSKVMDLPTFGSSKSNDQASDVSYSFSRSTSLSRFSSQSTTQGQEEPKNDIRMFSRQSSLSREVSLSREELSSSTKSEKLDKGSHSRNGLSSSEVLSESWQFHLSMYKWASKGLPSMMRGKGQNSSRLKDTGTKANAKSFGMDDNRKENDSLLSTITQSRAELSQMVGEKIISLPEFVTVSRFQSYVEDVSKDTVLEKSKEKMKRDSHSEVGLSGKADRGTHPAVVHETLKSDDPKPLRSLLNENSNEQGSDEITVKSGGNKVVNRSNNKEAVEKNQAGKKVKKQEEKRSALTGAKVDKASVKASARNSGSNLGDEYLKVTENRYSATKTENYISSDTSSKLKNTSVSSTASVPNVSKTVVGDTNEPFQRAFVMKELPQEKNEKPQPGKDHEDMQVFDVKIQKWSNGKEGNIRSLLSTLQYVLWAESGWKPVPLVNIIEGNAVKRVYQRALLCVHPDKLQQKGAALHQKYIAEKVFDILQEAWTQFSSLAPL